MYYEVQSYSCMCVYYIILYICTYFPKKGPMKHHHCSSVAKSSNLGSAGQILCGLITGRRTTFASCHSSLEFGSGECFSSRGSYVDLG